MERLKKALEKAYEERQQLPEESSEGALQTVNQPPVETEQISYAQSRNFSVSKEVLRHNRVIAGLDDHPHADLFKILRTKILQQMQLNNWNLLAVTSPTNGAGRTLTAVNLAISIAMDANYSVLLADLDLRNPGIHKYFNMPAEPGLSDYLSGKKSITELLVHPGMEKLVLLPAGASIQRSSDLLSTPKMLKLSQELKQRYPDRIVVVDLPPLLQTDDAMVFMPNVDACVLVVAEGENSVDDVQNSINLIEKEKYLGCVLNKSAEINSANQATY